MSGLEPTGVELVVKGLGGYTAALDKANSVTQKLAQGLSKAETGTGALESVQKSLGKSTDALGSTIGGLLENLVGANSGVGSLVSSMLDMVGISGGMAAGIAAVSAAVFTLGLRGGEVKGVQQAFDNLTASVGITSDKLLNNLSQASAGTIRDFDLMRQTNLALAGSTGQFAKEFGENLPKLLEGARLQAQATGQDVGFLFESLVTGIKRASPLLIDNTGLTISIGKANEQLAASLGKSVDQLTDQEKQLAVLRATLGGIDNAMQTTGEATVFANQRFVQTQTILGNILDSIGVAVEPVVNVVLQAVNKVLELVQNIIGAILKIAQPFIDVIVSIAGVIMSVLSPAIDGVGMIITTIGNILGGVFETLAAPFIAAFDIISEGFAFVGGLVNDVLGGVLGTIEGLANDIIGKAQMFLKGGFAIIGALAAGILRAANQHVFPAVEAIAKGIADFLVGFSPPKKGALSQIDKGGANVMDAWLAGFAGVSLDPVDQVAASVNASMGEIANYGFKEVKERVVALDAELAPFNDRLNIMKARFDALKPVTDAAFGAIDRQLEKAVQALATGDENAAALVRQLDAQRQALMDMTNARQDEIDQAEIQLALVKAQQSEERVLLDIRKRQLGVEPKEAVQREMGGAGAKEEKKKGGGKEAPMGAGGTGGGARQPAKGGGGGFSEDLKGAAGEGFAAGGGTEEFAKTQDAMGRIKGQLDRIGSSDFGKRFGDLFAKTFDPSNPESILGKVVLWFQETFDPNNDKSIFKWFSSLGTNIQASVTGIGLKIDTALVAPIRTKIAEIGAEFIKFFNGTEEGSLYSILFVQLPAKLGEFANSLKTTFVDPVTSKIEAIYTAFASLFTGAAEGSIPYLIGQALKSFGEFPAKLGAAFSTVGQFLTANFVNPVIRLLNTVIASLETFLNTVVADSIRKTGALALTFLQLVGQGNSELYNNLFKSLQEFNVSFGRIPEAATGGMFSSGMLSVGERGQEFIAPAQKIGVFPNEFVRAVESLVGVMSRPAPLPIPMFGGGGEISNQTSNMTNNFFGVQDPNDVVKRLAGMRIFGR